MVGLKHIPETNIVELVVDGEITEEEFDDIWTRLNGLIETYGTLRVLKRVESLGSPPLPMSRWWDDISLGFQNLGKFTHVALVTDLGWATSLSRILNPILKPEIKCFSLSEEADALDWLKTAE